MKKMFKFFISFTIIFLLVGCTTKKSYIFKVETNDNIKITIKTNNGYNINKKIPFELTRNNGKISYGFFITNEQYEKYISLLKENNNINIIESNSTKQIDYLLYKYNSNNSEYNYIIKIKNSNTGIIIANNISLESAKDMFQHLTFKKV